MRSRGVPGIVKHQAVWIAPSVWDARAVAGLSENAVELRRDVVLAVSFCDGD